MDSMVGWFAPTICVGCGTEGSSLCPICRHSEIIPFGERCWNCAALSPRAQTCQRCRINGSPRFIWIATDYDGLAKSLIQKYKFGCQRGAAAPLASIMAQTFWAFNSKEHVQESAYLVVPVPSASSRVRQRGFDHAMQLAKLLSKRLDLPISQPLLRVGQNRQVGTKRQQRLAQAQDSYKVFKPLDVTGRSILLVDDVVTTGATLQAASQKLRAAGVRHVDALVFAKRL